MEKHLEKVRVDKWLWAVRLFKSRSIAADAIKSGRVRMGELVLKPSHEVRRGDTIQVRKEGFNLTFKVVDLIEKRVGAALAQPCYENLTPESELNKFKTWYTGNFEVREKGVGRPTKRERRDIDKFKDFWDEFDLD